MELFLLGSVAAILVSFWFGYCLGRSTGEMAVIERELICLMDTVHREKIDREQKQKTG